MRTEHLEIHKCAIKLATLATVISSEPANATAEPYAPVYSEPVNAETIKAAAKEWCARACELEAQGCVARNNFVTAGALHSMAKLFREVNI